MGYFIGYCVAILVVLSLCKAAGKGEKDYNE
jgi:hypothetical protein